MKGRDVKRVTPRASRRALRLEGGQRSDTTITENPRPAARHVPWHVIAKRRARNRMRSTTRKKQRR